MKHALLALVIALSFPVWASAQIISATGSAQGAGGSPDASPPPRIIAATGTASGTGGPPGGPATCPSPLTEKDQQAIAINPALGDYFRMWWPPACPGGP